MALVCEDLACYGVVLIPPSTKKYFELLADIERRLQIRPCRRAVAIEIIGPSPGPCAIDSASSRKRPLNEGSIDSLCVILPPSVIHRGDTGEHEIDEAEYAALQKTRYVALAQIAMHRREHIAVIRAGDRGILMHTMFYANEVRKVQEFKADEAHVADKEPPMSAPKHSTTCAGGTDLLSRPPPRHGRHDMGTGRRRERPSGSGLPTIQLFLNVKLEG